MGHIVELGEELDYATFFEHGIPKGISDEEWRAEIGNRTWALYHGVMDHYPCPTCREAGLTLLSGIHDMVNISLGKGVFDRTKWKEFVSMVKAAVAADHAAGHKGRVKHFEEAVPKHQVGH